MADAHRCEASARPGRGRAPSRAARARARAAVAPQPEQGGLASGEQPAGRGDSPAPRRSVSGGWLLAARRPLSKTPVSSRACGRAFWPLLAARLMCSGHGGRSPGDPEHQCGHRIGGPPHDSEGCSGETAPKSRAARPPGARLASTPGKKHGKAPPPVPQGRECQSGLRLAAEQGGGSHLHPIRRGEQHTSGLRLRLWTAASQGPIC